MPFKIPPDLAGDIRATLTAELYDPAVATFAALAFDEVPWSPGWPRLLLRLSGWLGLDVAGPDRAIVLMTGFCVGGKGDRLRRIGRAVAALLRCWRRRGQFIYADGRDLLILDSGEPRQQWGASSSALRPVAYPSVVDSLSPPAAPSTAPPPPPRPPAGPLTPALRPYLTRRG
jgi:hypothetical protein